MVKAKNSKIELFWIYQKLNMLWRPQSPVGVPVDPDPATERIESDFYFRGFASTHDRPPSSPKDVEPESAAQQKKGSWRTEWESSSERSGEIE